tara:strand:- start:1346 stop:2041 length:696 start_codon:yes stop_codon:yes gene_type:complete
LFIDVVKEMKKIILLILFPVLTYGQANDNSMIGTNIGLDLAYIKRELSMPYKSNRLNIDGNKYFFKKPSNATLVLTEEETPVNVITNYNLLEQSFDVFDGTETLKLLPNKIKKVIFPDKEFISINDKFYEVIEINDNFSLLADTYLEIYFPEYTPGIQDKPDPKYRKKNSVFLYYKDRFNYVERRKSFLISMFDKNIAKEVNSFMKKNKISPRDNDELKSLFIEFHPSLNR